MIAGLNRLFVLLCLLSWGLAGCSQQPNAATGPAANPVVERPAAERPKATASLELVTAALQPWPRVVRVQGSLIADEETVVGAKVAGRVAETKVDIGTAVRQGQLLAVLEGEDFELRVKQAEAQVAQVRSKLGLKGDEPDSQLNRLRSPPVVQELALVEEARANVERGRQLSKQNAFSAEELARREAILRVADARYATALNMVDEQIAVLAARRVDLAVARQLQTDSQIAAPFDGVIQQLHVAPGTFPNIGHPIVTLVRVDPLRFRAGVPEHEALRIEVGQTVRLYLTGDTKPLTAKICRIAPALDMASRSLMIEADIANAGGKLPVGLFAEAEIVIDPMDQALAVPTSAITEFAGVEKVRLLRGDQEEEVSVHTGRRRGDLVEVLEGLTVGDRVLSGSRRIQARVPRREGEPSSANSDSKPASEAQVKTSLGA